MLASSLSPTSTHGSTTICQSTQSPLASTSLELLNSLQRIHKDDSLCNVRSLFAQNKIVIIGEDHSYKDGLRYAYHNREFLCDPQNDVLILTEGFPVGTTTDEIFQANTHVYCSLIRDGAKVRGMETAYSAKLMFDYDIIRTQFDNAVGSSPEKLPELAQQLHDLTKKIQGEFKSNDPETDQRMHEIDTFLASYNGDVKKLLDCFNFISTRLLTIVYSQIEDRNSLNPDFARVIESERKNYKNVLVITGGDHAIDTINDRGLKTLLNENIPGIAESYCMNFSDEFSSRQDFYGQSVLCLPGKLYPNDVYMRTYGQSFNHQPIAQQPIPEQQNGNCVLF